MYWKYVVTFPEDGHPRRHQDTLPRPCSPQSPRCLKSINAMLLMHPTPRPLPIYSRFLLFLHSLCLSVLKMYWRVVLAVDCRNSVRRIRVCRNSVCLPLTTLQMSPQPLQRSFTVSVLSSALHFACGSLSCIPILYSITNNIFITRSDGLFSPIRVHVSSLYGLKYGLEIPNPLGKNGRQPQCGIIFKHHK